MSKARIPIIRLVRSSDSQIMTNKTIVNWIRESFEGHGPRYAHLWYGVDPFESPLLSVACFPGVGMFLAFPGQDGVMVYASSKNFELTHSITWGQDDIVIPNAYFMSPLLAENVVKLFSINGTIPAGEHWHRIHGNDLYPDLETGEQ